jgi:hypothetical protein
MGYVFANSAPLTADSCNSSISWNYQDPRDLPGVNGEYRGALYYHYGDPNPASFDCISTLVTGPLKEIDAEYHWPTARSLPDGLNLVPSVGFASFVPDGVKSMIWLEISTRNNSEPEVSPLP